MNKDKKLILLLIGAGLLGAVLIIFLVIYQPVRLVSVSPEDEAIGVPIEAFEFKAEFSSSITNGATTTFKIEPNVKGDLKVSNNVLTFRATEYLQPFEKYTISFIATPSFGISKVFNVHFQASEFGPSKNDNPNYLD